MGLEYPNCSSVQSVASTTTELETTLERFVGEARTHDATQNLITTVKDHTKIFPSILSICSIGAACKCSSMIVKGVSSSARRFSGGACFRSGDLRRWVLDDNFRLQRCRWIGFKTRYWVFARFLVSTLLGWHR